MNLIEVKQSSCIKCGICTKVCPTKALFMDKNGPKASGLDSCIACGQCVAVCPKGALDNVKAPLSNQVAIENFPTIDSETAELFLRSRRSIRCYKDTPIPRENLLQLIDIARFAPTASNSQGLSYLIIEDRKVLDNALTLIVQWMEAQIGNSTHWSFSRHINAYRKDGVDTIFRGAPHLILATAPKEFKNGRENSISALTYVELFATTLGLGSCWAGLFEMCAFSNYKPLLELFNIPEDKKITAALMVGYPKYKAKRLVARNALDVSFQ